MRPVATCEGHLGVSSALNFGLQTWLSRRLNGTFIKNTGIMILMPVFLPLSFLKPLAVPGASGIAGLLQAHHLVRHFKGHPLDKAQDHRSLYQAGATWEEMPVQVRVRHCLAVRHSSSRPQSARPPPNLSSRSLTWSQGLGHAAPC